MMRSLLMVVVLCAAPVAPTRAAVSPGLGDIYVVKAREAFERGADRDALAFVEQARANGLQGELWHYARFLGARAALRSGAPLRALDYTDRLESELLRVGDFALALRASALQHLDRWSEARATWETLATAFPSSPLLPAARYGIADAHFSLGGNDAAEAAYDVALRAYGRDARATAALFNVALLAEAKGHFARAGAIYRDLAKRPQDEPTAQRAIERLETLITSARVEPPSLGERLAYVDRLISLHSLAAAQSTLNEIKSSAPSNRDVLYREGRLANLRGDYDAAIRAFSDLSLRNQGWRRYRYLGWLARAHAAAGQFDAAVAIYEDLARRYRDAPEGPVTLYMAAWLALDGGNYRRAVELFDAFLRQYPRDRRADEAMWYKAWSTYHLGALAEADLALDELQRRFPNSALMQRVQYWGGRIMAQMTYVEEAIERFEAVQSGESGYYAALATQRIEELTGDPGLRQWGETGLLASLEVPPGGESSAPPPRPRRDPTLLGAGRRAIDWGEDVFDWQSPAAQRALTLIHLAYPEYAAAIIAELPARDDTHDGNAVTYARARLLHALGDYAGSYERIALVFEDALKTPVTRATLRYYQLAFPLAYQNEIERASQEFGVSRWLLLAVMRQESAFEARSLSSANATGLMQIIASTGQRIAAALGHEPFSSAGLSDPQISIRFAAWYLRQLLTKFHGNVALAVGSYNAGPRAMEKWVDAHAGGCVLDEFIEDISYRETRHYVKRVLANLAVYAELYGKTPLRLPDNVPQTYRDNVDF